MGEAKRKAVMGQVGDKSVAKRVPIGSGVDAPPTNNMGGKGGKPLGDERGQLASDRYRLNVSLPPAVHRALTRASIAMGTSASQLALQAIINGLPTLTSQVGAALSLAGRDDE